jgi:phosphate transport system permease protein
LPQPIEKSLIKPYIEFISAIPSVVLGFFGIAVLGETIRAISRASFMQWVPFFPNQRAPECFYRGLFARPDGCAHDFYSR